MSEENVTTAAATPLTEDIALELTVEERLASLEQQLAGWRKRAVAAGGALALVLLLLAGSLFSLTRRGGENYVATVLQAERIVLRDAAGQKRAELSTSADADLSFILLDPSEQERMRFSVLPDGASGVTLFDRAGRTRMAMGVLSDQTVSLAFADPQGMARTVLGQGLDQSTNLVFAGPDGATRAALGVAADGEPELLLREGALSPLPISNPISLDTLAPAPEVLEP